MNKLLYLIAITLVSVFAVSCEKGTIEVPEPPVFPEVPPVVPEPGKAFLGINPTIAGVEAVTRGVITNFTDNDKIGLFLTTGELGNNYQNNAEAANVSASYFASAWEVQKEILITVPGTVYGYYPFNDKVADGKLVPVEIASQTDYLYARKTVVDEKNPIAQIGMQHALSLVSVRIRKNDYQHAGKLTKIEVLDVQETGTVNIASGEVVKTGALVTYAVDRNIVLDDDALVKTQMIMLPNRIADAGNVRLRVTIDAKIYIWDVPKSHNWEAGKEYTYTLNLSKIPEVLPDLELDIDYWTKYGKDDNITIEDHTQPGSAYYRVVDVEMGSTPYGRTVVQGESYIFSGVVNERKSGFKGRVKYTLWQGDKMVEQFPSYYFECRYYTTLRIPSFITCAPGTYRLKMLLKEEGSNVWILPSDRYSEERDWMFTVKSGNEIPSISSMNLEGFSADNNRILSVKLNQPFNMEYTLTNRAALPLKGEIKAVWHRTFTGEFHAVRDDDGSTWEDEVGRASIDIPASVKEFKSTVSCKITTQRTYPKKWSPTISLYYRTEGSSAWKLMRSDSDSELQRWKGADVDKIIMGSEEHPELSWRVGGGINHQYIALE
ncbi:MAG: fimbrillin family protein [Bacteroides sp.]|uniref:fimbrillin family protein n=1 Tax=Bacteroides sp. TaxID=29523 RepID=UPI002FC68D06